MEAQKRATQRETEKGKKGAVLEAYQSLRKSMNMNNLTSFMGKLNPCLQKRVDLPSTYFHIKR